MTRTRLRGLEIGGIQIGIEVPETFAWPWPNGAIADFCCLPREPEVHVGVRVGHLDDHDLGGERYRIGAWTFEVARRGEDWLLGLTRRGRREQLAIFDREFHAGEVVVSADSARQPGFPLRSPLDEWIVVHRTVARGGLCLNAVAQSDEGHASLLLGGATGSGRPPTRWSTSSPGLFGRNTLLVREQAGRLRCFRTPWSDAMDIRLGSMAPVLDLTVVEETESPYRELLDPQDAAELLVAHAVVPLCDEGLLDGVLRNARRIGEGARVLRIGEAGLSPAPMEWGSAHLQSAFAPPQTGF